MAYSSFAEQLIRRAGVIAIPEMAIPESDKRKEYAHYAAHCLYLVTSATDPDSRAIQREMAAEWLKLADSFQQPSKPAKKQIK